MKKLLVFISFFTVTTLTAQNYRASMFGIKSDGITMNTRSIQKAIDFISEKGGGELQFSVGRYLTGSIHLKSNVTLRLNEGAILVGSLNPYDYDMVGSDMGLILAKDQKNIAIKGKGVIDGRGRDVALNIITQVQMGFIDNPLRHDRSSVRPRLLQLRECENVSIDSVLLKNAGDWTLVCDQCTHLTINHVLLDSKNYWNNDGIDLVDCRHVKMTNCIVDASDDAICLKSHDPNTLCEDIEIRNCTARSSASGIKFGTVSRGGFKNIRIINNKVYDTHRSAITIASVDGAEIEDIIVDSLYATNTSNAIYLRTGDRWTSGKKGYLRNVTISNVRVEVPATKADVGYSYEGPVEDNPRNISPASIVGIPSIPIENITIQNVEIIYPGGGNPKYAYRGTSNEELRTIPEMEASYPEFSQFKELPAWGFFIKHANNITFKNVTLTAKERDYRPAVVLDHVQNSRFSKMKYIEPGGSKKQFVTNNSKNIK